MGPVAVAATIFFVVERAWFISAVTAIMALYCSWRFRVLR
jgi:hypothetical protein